MSAPSSPPVSPEPFGPSVAVGSEGAGSANRDDLLRGVVRSLGAVPHRVERLPARPGITVNWPEWANHDVVSSFRSGGVDRPWRHQATAADSIRAGQHTVIATGTASGKSLAYLLPALTGLLDGDATALYVSPTKALAQDQLKSLNAMSLDPIRASTYDGDTPTESRPWIRAQSNYILTNPEMIHRGILPSHASWRRFMRNLQFLIIDEAHQYRGVFGTHMSAVIRRMRRVARHYGAEPTCIAVSATMAQPEVSAANLFGTPVASVTEDTSRRGEIALLLVDPSEPPLGESATEPSTSSARAGSADRRIEEPNRQREPDDPLEREETSFSLAAGALTELNQLGASALGFIRARKGAEALAESVRGKLRDDLAPTVTAYRGGLLPEERRRVEQDLKTGRLRTVATTNALELGIDISGLDAVLVCGWPGTRASFLQQIGRAGRNGQDALAVFIASDNPLDRYLVGHPERILREPLETATFDPQNPHVLLPHIAAAVAELPIVEDPSAWFGPQAAELLSLLVTKGWVRRRHDGWYWTSRTSATELADLRGAGRGPVAITEVGTGRLLGTVDESSAPAHVHPGAVYRHLGSTYMIEVLDLDALVALARPDRPPFTTTAKTVTDLRIERQESSRPCGLGEISFGEVRVTVQVVGFVRKSLSGEFLGAWPLDLPEATLATRAVWWRFPAEVLAAIGLDAADVPGAVHAAEHAAIGMLPGLATCDRWDLGGLSSAQHEDTDEATVFVYDGHPGGAGIAHHGYRHIRDWLGATRDAIASCRCESGCPGCVQSPKCGNGNEPLDKTGAVALLDVLLAGDGLPHGQV